MIPQHIIHRDIYIYIYIYTLEVSTLARGSNQTSSLSSQSVYKLPRSALVEVLSCPLALRIYIYIYPRENHHCDPQ